MRAGFKFKGQHSGEFEGVTVKTNDRPVRPDTKESTYNPTNADSEHSFARANPYGHEYYNDKVFQMEIKVIASDLSDLQRKITKLSMWIMGSGELIFDDTPLVKWDARIIDTVQYMPEHGGHDALLVVKYKVKPFSELVFDISEGPSLDDDVELDSDIPLDMGEYFTFEGEGTHTVQNIGDMPVRPVITVTGASREYSISCNGFTLKIPENAVIDCERYTVTNMSGASLMTRVKGDFPELAAGKNTLTVTGGGDITIEVQYEPRYVHNVDTRDMRLED